MLLPNPAVNKWGRTSSVVFNPSDKDANVTLSNGNADMVRASGTTWANARCVTAISSGKWYWEYKLLNVAGSVGVGIVNSGASLSAFLGSTANGWGGVFSNTLPVQVTGVTRDYATNLPSGATNDIIGVAFNRTAGTVFLHRNGTYFNSGDPVAGTGSVVSAMNSGSWYPAGGTFDTTGSLRIIADRASFTYSIPSGYVPYGAASLLVQ